MVEDFTRNQCPFYPYVLNSHSSEGTMFLSRENSFYETKFSSKEFQLQYNKSFKTINSMNQSCDSKLNQMLAKTSSNNVFNLIEECLNSIEEQSAITTNELYMKMSECLLDVLQITFNPPFDKEDYAKALNYQSILVEKMIKFVDVKLINESVNGREYYC